MVDFTSGLDLEQEVREFSLVENQNPKSLLIVVTDGSTKLAFKKLSTLSRKGYKKLQGVLSQIEKQQPVEGQKKEEDVEGVNELIDGIGDLIETLSPKKEQFEYIDEEYGFEELVSLIQVIFSAGENEEEVKK